jgi:hypothetical protein
MVDWLAIGFACALAALIGVGFVLWERYENERLARARLRRRTPRRRHSRPVDTSADHRAA